MLCGDSFEGMESRQSLLKERTYRIRKAIQKGMCQNNVESTAVLNRLCAVSILGTRSCLKCCRQRRKNQTYQYYLISWKMHLSCY